MTAPVAFTEDGLRWVRPREARAILIERGYAKPDAETKLAQLAGMEVKGRAALRTRAQRLMVGEQTPLFFGPVHLWLWTGSDPTGRAWQWELGNFAGKIGRAPLKAEGVEFCLDDLDDLEPPSVTTVHDEPASILPSNTGGKSSDKHGEPIARATLKLMAMPDAEFAREKGETIKNMLPLLYRDARAQPPSDKNLEGIAYGILRAVKEARKPAS